MTCGLRSISPGCSSCGGPQTTTISGYVYSPELPTFTRRSVGDTRQGLPFT